jgi:UDP-N-acetylmuramoylalanine--D-glutamate ligase
MSETSAPRAVVVGLGASGVAAARLLVRQGWRVTVTDLKLRQELGQRLAELPAGVATVLGGHPPELLGGTSLVVTSPGVAWDAPFLVEARAQGIEVLAEVELAYRTKPEVPIAGVTGSNGKSTVTALLGEILRSAGLRVGVGGNIGHPACALALDGESEAWVLELSSFQLEGSIRLRPRVGLLLNVSADHLDRHAGMTEYLALKARLFANQEPSDWAVLNADDPAVSGLSVPSTVIRFSLHDRRAEAHLAGTTLVLDGAALLPRAELPLLGDHNVANALAAALGAARMGAPVEAITASLRSFQGLPHRHQVVAQGGGVRWVEDSKGTNIGATAAGLAGYTPGTIHLILGGLGKGQDFRELRAAVSWRVARAYLIGRAAEEIASALEGAVALERCGTLKEAVRRAAARARAGDTVLLSPACASFDQFRDYADRGETFARLARAAAGGA